MMRRFLRFALALLLAVAATGSSAAVCGGPADEALKGPACCCPSSTGEAPCAMSYDQGTLGAFRVQSVPQEALWRGASAISSPGNTAYIDFRDSCDPSLHSTARLPSEERYLVLHVLRL